MANGVQRTPFDTIDLGGQLLQALVSGQQTKEAKERLKLQEKQLALDEKQQQLQALPFISPQGRGDILSSLFGGQQVEPYVSPQEQEFAQLQDYLKANPDVAEMYRRIQTTGTPLPTGEALDAARVASGAKLSARDRLSAFQGLLEQFGSPAAASVRGAYREQLGVQIPQGVKTLPERAVGAEEKRAKETGATAEAARVRARQDSIEFVAGGFQPLPGSEAAKNPALARKYAEELTKFSLGEQNLVSPEAITQMVPLAKWAQILKASAAPSPEFKARLDLYKQLLDFANKQKGEVDKQTLQQIQTLGQSLYDEVLPPTESGGPIVEGESSFLSGPLGVMLGFAVGKPSQVSLGGRPLKPEIQEALRLATRSTGAVVLETGLKLLEKAYQQVLPLITTEPSKPPVIPPTLGPLSSERAAAIPPDAKSKMQGLVAAYRAAGGSADEAAAIEGELLDVFTRGDAQDQQEYIQGLLADIKSMKETGVLEPRE